ncbi:hypothetical protein [Clostridium sp. HBUAS56017]|uniref:hypothetical protein n=1 Tax=Clostridium sp. HBUAS56017 TaxID=2571128 RepID=UPI0011774B3E|nr:hypothetical protein [Clostridium sp. HBUAS56017]
MAVKNAVYQVKNSNGTYDEYSFRTQATSVMTDANNRFVSDADKAAWNLGNVVTWFSSDRYTWYAKFPSGLLLCGGGTAGYPNVGGTIIDINITLPSPMPAGFELKFYTSICPADPSKGNWSSASPTMYQLNSNTARILVNGSLTPGAGYSISYFGVGRWK